MEKIVLRIVTSSGESRAVYLDDLTKTEILNELRNAVYKPVSYRHNLT